MQKVWGIGFTDFTDFTYALSFLTNASVALCLSLTDRSLRP